MATATPPFKVKALFQYSTDYEEDLNFDVGQLITVSEIEDEEWFSGYYDEDGVRKEGIFPKTFVAVVAAPKEAVQHAEEQPDSAEELEVEVEERKDVELEQEVKQAHSPQQQKSQQEQPQGVGSQFGEKEEKEHSTKQETSPIDVSKPKVATTDTVTSQEAENTENSGTSPVRRHNSTSHNEMLNRISTFNHGTVAPMPTKGPVNEAPVKKSFVAAPSSYVPQGFGDKPKPKSVSQETHPANVISEHSQREEEEEEPKMSLKERIALLQKRQQEEAERAQAILKRKEHKKKKKEQQYTQAPELQETETEPTETNLDRSKTADSTAASQQGELIDAALPVEHEQGIIAKDQEISGVEKQEITPSVANESEDDQSDNENIESNQGNTIENELANEDEDDARSQEEIEEHRSDNNEDDDKEEEDDEEEEDEEEVKRRNLRERMAKLSGGVGMFGMMGVPTPFGAPAGGKPASKNEKKAVKTENENLDVTGSKLDSLPNVAAAQAVGASHFQLPDDGSAPSDESELVDESDEVTSQADATAPDEQEVPTSVSSHPPIPLSARQVPIPTPRVPVSETEVHTASETTNLPPLYTQGSSKEEQEVGSPISPSVVPPKIPSIPKRTPVSPSSHRAPPVPAPAVPISPQNISPSAQRRLSQELGRSIPKVPPPGVPPIPTRDFVDPGAGVSETSGSPDVPKQTISDASEAPPLVEFDPEAMNQNFNHEHHSPEDSDNNVTGYEADEDTDVNRSPSHMATKPSVPIPEVRKAQTEVNQIKDPKVGRSQTLPPAAPAPPIPGFAPNVPSPKVPSRVRKEAPPPPPVPAPTAGPAVAQQHPLTLKEVPSGSNSIERKNSVLSATQSNKFTDQTWYVKGRAPPGFSARIHDDVLLEVDTNTIRRRGNRNTIYRDFYVLSFDLSQDVFEVEWDESLPEEAETKHHRIDAPVFTVDTLVWNSQEYGSKVFQLAHSFIGKQLDASLVETIFSQIEGILPPIGVKGYGATIYKNNSNSSVSQHDEFRPGDVLCMLKSKFVGHKLKPAFEVGNKTEPYCGIISEFDSQKNKLRVIEQDSRGKVKANSYRLNDFKSGKIRVFRPIGRDAIGW
ncbi:BA75_03674T0 [Komagataella pastoris]|uniref:BA75_03674T0 n=1 Tax=Komagataella pastoris TaxID=4922 RepID=A0A1B2JED8_PICPA|nr:BA75_03674T0 [Komagataella pastoris]